MWDCAVPDKTGYAQGYKNDNPQSGELGRPIQGKRTLHENVKHKEQ